MDRATQPGIVGDVANTMPFLIHKYTHVCRRVIRDCGGRCALQASSDLTAWSDLGAVGSRFGAVQPTAVKARYLRVLMPAATQLGILSVW